MRAAESAREAGDLRGAGELAVRAEALWRGAYAEGLAGPYLEAERRRWAEDRLRASEARLEGEIERGRSAACVDELTRLVAAHPLRERAAGLLVRALQQGGRPAAQEEVPAAYGEARAGVVEVTDLGAAPGARSEDVQHRNPAPRPGSLPAA